MDKLKMNRAPRLSDTIPINYIGEPATVPQNNSNPDYAELRRQHARAMMREVMAGNVTGQGRQALKVCK